MTQIIAPSCRRFVTVALILAALTAVLLPGCKARGPILANEPEPPDYAALAERHNNRIDMLEKVHARGNIELRWRDEDASHFEQGDLDFFLHLPYRTAFRVSKLGDTYFWFGSNEDHYWVFDLFQDETLLVVARHGEPMETTETLAVQPLLLLPMMGIARLPEPNDAAPQLIYCRDHDAWQIDLTNGSGTLRMFLDRDSHLPKRAELDGADGTLLLSSTIRRYRSVTVPGTAAANFPRLATLVDVVLDDRPENLDRSEMKIALTRPTADVAEMRFERIFDLDELIKAHRPRRIEGPIDRRAAAR